MKEPSYSEWEQYFYDIVPMIQSIDVKSFFTSCEKILSNVKDAIETIQSAPLPSENVKKIIDDVKVACIGASPELKGRIYNKAIEELRLLTDDNSALFYATLIEKKGF